MGSKSGAASADENIELIIIDDDDDSVCNETPIIIESEDVAADPEEAQKSWGEMLEFRWEWNEELLKNAGMPAPNKSEKERPLAFETMALQVFHDVNQEMERKNDRLIQMSEGLLECNHSLQEPHPQPAQLKECFRNVSIANRSTVIEVWEVTSSPENIQGVAKSTSDEVWEISSSSEDEVAPVTQEAMDIASPFRGWSPEDVDKAQRKFEIFRRVKAAVTQEGIDIASPFRGWGRKDVNKAKRKLTRFRRIKSRVSSETQDQ